MIKESSVETFLAELASSKATPGGGSAPAVMGAMADVLAVGRTGTSHSAA